jgi:anti-anti-sigma factor
MEKAVLPLNPWAILDMLTDGVAILDPEGTICYANQAFLQMFSALSGEDAVFDLGYNYLDQAKLAFQQNRATFEAIANGLQAVMTGEKQVVSLDYALPCAENNFSSQQRWFKLTLTAYDLGSERGILLQQQDLTKVRIPEQTFQTAEDFAQIVADTTPVLLSYIDKEHRYRFNNALYRQWHGVNDRAEAYGKHCKEVLGEAYYQRIKPFMEQALAGVPTTFESFVTDKDEKIRDIRVQYVPHSDEQGEIKGFVVIVADITESKRLEQELRQQRELLQSIADTLPALIAYIDTDQRYQFVNNTYETWHQFSRTTMYGRSMQEILGPELYQIIEKKVNLALQGQTISFETLITYQDGKTRHVRAQYTPHFDSEKIVKGFVVSIIDVTEYKQLEQELREKENHFHTFYILAENAPNGVSVVELDAERTISYANLAYRQMTGWGKDADLIEMSLDQLDLLPEATAKQVYQQLLTTGFWQDLVEVRRRDGSTFPAHVSSFFIRDDEGKPLSVASVFVDLSERVRQEAERQALQEQVIHTQQAVLREISTPLIPISKGVVVIPLVGKVDSGRALQMVETLLEGITKHKAKTAILDITGVPVVDTQVAKVLLQTAQAVKLLGSRIVITGIRPEVAQTLVTLGMDLSSLVIRHDLQSGIAYALEQQRKVRSKGR